MKKNIGTKDRIVRLIIGLIALGLILFVTSPGLKEILLIIGLVSITQALLSRCLIYAMLGKNTCPVE